MTLPVPSAFVAKPGMYDRPRNWRPVLAVRNVTTAATSLGSGALTLVPSGPATVLGTSGWFGTLTSRSVTPMNCVEVARNPANAVQAAPVDSAEVKVSAIADVGTKPPP